MRSTGEILAAMAQKGATMGNCGKMCTDCAFRLQPDINHYAKTCEEALDLLATGQGRLNCHTPDYEDAGTPCVGFMYAKQYCDALDRENEKPEESSTFE